MMKGLLTFFVILIFFLPVNGRAQVCTGSLGTPLMQVNFGQGNNPGQPLHINKTSYQYTTEQCFDDGIYSIRNAEYNCHFSTWHNITDDHTRNGSGYFMLVNAAAQGSVIYTDTIRNLCGGGTYEIAAWFINLNVSSTCNGNPIKPDIGFVMTTLSGAVLQTYHSGEIPVTSGPEWKQCGTFFTAPAGGADVIFKIINAAPGGCGNDFAMDDITVRPCGPLLISTVDGNTSPVIFCEGTAGSFNLNTNVTGTVTGPSWQWQLSTDSIHYNDIAGANSISYVKNFTATQAPGKYFFRAALLQVGQTSANCRVFSSPVMFRIDPLPVALIRSNSPVCENTDLKFTATGDPVLYWTTPSGIVLTGNPLILPGMNASMTGKYYVRLATALGCEKTDSLVVTMNPAPTASVSFTDSTICSGSQIMFHASGGTAYSWSPAAGFVSPASPDPVVLVYDSAVYNVIVKNSFMCADTAYINVNAIKKPLVNAGPDRTIILGTPVQLTGAVSGNVAAFSWISSPWLDDPLTLKPFVSPPAEMKFVLSAAAVRGCGIGTDTVKVKVFNDIYIPNIFTPNGDGRNDSWRIPSLDAFSAVKISVFNRDGLKLFETTDSKKGWTGRYKEKDLPSGNYVYIITIAGRAPLRGNLILVR